MFILNLNKCCFEFYLFWNSSIPVSVTSFHYSVVEITYISAIIILQYIILQYIILQYIILQHINPAIYNPSICNPTIFNPTIYNPTIYIVLQYIILQYIILQNIILKYIIHTIYNPYNPHISLQYIYFNLKEINYPQHLKKILYYQKISKTQILETETIFIFLE